MSTEPSPLHCEMSPVAIPGDDSPDLFHVGQRYEIQCSGDFSRFNTVRTPKIVDKNFKWSPKLKLLEVKSASDATLHFEAVTYMPGENTSEELFLFDGAEKIEIPGLSWKVQSVLPAKGQATQMPKPFPSYGPALLNIAWYYWLGLVLLLCVVGWFFYSFVRKTKQKKALIEELRQHQTSLSAFDQFFRDARYLERDLDLEIISNEEFYKKINDYFLLYLVREFEVPAQDWGTRDIMSGIRKTHRAIYRKIRSDLSRMLTELKRGHTKRVKRSDCEYLLKLSQSIAEKAEEIKDLEAS